LDTQVLAFAGSSRIEKFGDIDYRFEKFDIRKIRDFKPTLVLDAAFLTREKVSTITLENYISSNTALIEQALELQQLTTVQKFVGISSGASLPHLKIRTSNFALDPYGSLKATYEHRLLQNHELRAKTTIGRIWSVSGKLVTKPSVFAFSDLAKQALGGAIKISAPHEVWRRYVDLEDFLKVVLLAHPGQDRVIDSGGELIEIGQLAQLIFEVLGTKPKIARTLVSGLQADRYYSDDISWQEAASQINLIPKNIRDQIALVTDALAKTGVPQ
jgi:nucleoside-diphosphate-sugar epimerase